MTGFDIGVNVVQVLVVLVVVGDWMAGARDGFKRASLRKKWMHKHSQLKGDHRQMREASQPELDTQVVIRHEWTSRRAHSKSVI